MKEKLPKINCPDCNEPMEVKKFTSPKEIAEDFGKIVFKELWKLNKDHYRDLNRKELAEEFFKSGIEHSFLTAEKLHEDLKKAEENL